MALSSGLRNRLVGFAIVVSAVIILLPLVLSKDVLQRPDPQAIAINSQGAVYDEKGNLQVQSTPDLEGVFNINSSNELTELNAPATTLPSTTTPEQSGNVAEVASDNSVEMLEFSSGAVPPSSSKPQVEETLIAQQPQPSKPVPTESAAAPQAPAEPPKPPISSASQDGPKVVAGAKPTGKFTIQVGVFSKKSNADNTIKKILGAGINAYAVEINSSGRILYRVYAGSANNRNDLKDTLQTVDKLCDTKGKIVSL